MDMLKTVLSNSIFWGWNLLFLNVILFGFGPAVLYGTLGAAWFGIIPMGFAIAALLLFTMPLAGMALGLWKFRERPGRLLSLFYGVQGPIMMLCLVRLFAFQQLTATTQLALLGFAIGTGSLLWTLLVGWEEDSKWRQSLRMAGQTVYLAYGLWFALAIGVFTVPLVTLVLGNFGFGALAFLIDPFLLLMVFFWLGTLAVLASFPMAMIGISIRSWVLVARATRQKVGLGRAGAITVLTLAVMLGMGSAVSTQEQRTAVALIQGDRQTALNNTELIRRGLLDAYLWEYRYLSTDDEMFVAAQNIWKEGFFELVGPVGGTLASAIYTPFLYQPARFDQQEPSTNLRTRSWNDRAQEANNAAAAYAFFFDEPITRAERDTIVAAAESTIWWERAAASAADVGQQRIWLEQQDVVIAATGDHATVTVHDVYRNTTFNRLEVVVYFSVPEHTALTGLWLGTSPDRDEAFTHVVAPRGAAQQVYEEQVRTNRDPALLEQVGPRQYRLRAFPIEPREGDGFKLSTVTDVGPAFHLWMELAVLSERQENGSFVWPMPDEAEVRNLFWNVDTTRTLNGEPTSWDGWLPEYFEGAAPQQQHTVAMGGELVVLSPHTPQPGQLTLSANTLVLVDTTRSMARHRELIEQTLAKIDPGSVYGIDKEGLNLQPNFDANTHLFWGSASLVEMLTHLEEYPHNADEILLITDRTTYTAVTDRSTPFALPPLRLLHLDGLPLAYSDAVLDTLTANRGRVGTTLQQVLGEGGNGQWKTALIPETTDNHEANHTLTALAARAFIHNRAGFADPSSVGDLDQLHQLAKQHDLVTPYSSMIVLVTDTQRDRLKDLSKDEDRFEREADADVTANDMDNVLTSTPEPEEWLLILLALAGLGLAYRRRQNELKLWQVSGRV